MEDVEQVFRVFDTEGSGEISLEELMQIKHVRGLVFSESDISKLAADADKDGSGQITVKELYRALVQGEVAFLMIKRALHNETQQHFRDTECATEDLIDWMHMEFEISTSLWSLPKTVFTTMFFILSAALHMNLNAAFDTSYLAGQGDMQPYRMSWIFDMPTFWAWMDATWASLMFQQDLKQQPGLYFRENRIMGGVRLRRRHTKPEAFKIPPYLAKAYYPSQFFGNLAYKRGEVLIDDRWLLYHEKVDILKERMRNLSSQFWLDANTTELSVDTLTLNPTLGTWQFGQQKWELENNGFVRSRYFQETWVCEPYRTWLHAVPDMIYLFFISRLLIRELCDVIPAAKAGLDSLMQYFDFWKVVDWLAISWGLTCTTIWIMILLQNTDSFMTVVAEMNEPIRQLDAIVIKNKSYMTQNEVNIVISHEDLYAVIGKVFDKAQSIAQMHELLRMFCVVYVFVLVMNFFKAFGANKQLDVVIQTIVGSRKDVGHFFLVFMTIFLCYAVQGHVMFGWSTFGFSTPLRSVYFRWAGGGVGHNDMEDLTYFGQVVGYLYTFSFEFLVSNLLLGILFGLIFEAYGKAAAAAGNPPTVFKQYWDSIRAMKDQRGMDMWSMVCALDSEDAPVHPGILVTSKSLRQAFKDDGLTKQQALYLISNGSKFAKDKFVEAKVTQVDLLKIIAQTRTWSSKAVLDCERVIEFVKAETRKPLEIRYECIMAGLDPDVPEDVREILVRKAEQQAPTIPTIQTSKSRLALPGEAGDTEELTYEQSLELKADKIVVNFGKFIDTVQKLCRQQKLLWKDIRGALDHCSNGAGVEVQRTYDSLESVSQTFLNCEVGISDLVGCFSGADLRALSKIPDRLSDLAALSKTSRQATASGAQGSGSDPVKRVETQIKRLGAGLQSAADDVDAHAGLHNALSRLEGRLAEIRRMRDGKVFEAKPKPKRRPRRSAEDS
eukprot:TRINITY_DN5549_c1_g1_i1.p1 TRINITY_DN5549_c1_g1~~TRINITY_DN5549_c1_g1_i1.p1  ORF type:complete len:1095 (+),score=183.57 TRINITY_DN5549_c1_g1_i1:439-3285(+)